MMWQRWIRDLWNVNFETSHYSSTWMQNRNRGRALVAVAKRLNYAEVRCEMMALDIENLEFELNDCIESEIQNSGGEWI